MELVISWAWVMGGFVDGGEWEGGVVKLALVLLTSRDFRRLAERQKRLSLWHF